MPARAVEHQTSEEAQAPAPALVTSGLQGRILELQQTAGNAAVGALLARKTADAGTVPALDELRKLLADRDESGAIAHMGRMEPNECVWALGREDLRSLAVKAFDDEEMAHAMYAMRGGTLVQKLNWMSVEGSSWKLVKPLLTDKRLPPGHDQKLEVYPKNYLRSFFSDICGDDQMEEAVKLLGGSLPQQLNWMFVEGTNAAAVKRRIRDHEPDKRPAVYRYEYLRAFFVDLVGDDGMAEMVDLIGGPLNDRLRWMAEEDTNFKAVAARIRTASETDLKGVTAETRKELRKDLSAKEWARIEDMLDKGVLDFEEFDSHTSESHWEKKDYKDPKSKWYMETFRVDSKYEIQFRRSELLIRVRIRLTGIPAKKAHLDLWNAGINRIWNNRFYLENADGKKLEVRFEPAWNAPDPHHTIELLPPIKDEATGKMVKGRANAGQWYAGPNANGVAGEPEDTSNELTAAHEFGHLVGLPDEYQLCKKDYKRLVGVDPVGADVPGGFSSGSIMGLKSHGAETRHITKFVDWLNRHLRSGEKPYSIKEHP